MPPKRVCKKPAKAARKSRSGPSGRSGRSGWSKTNAARDKAKKLKRETKYQELFTAKATQTELLTPANVETQTTPTPNIAQASSSADLILEHRRNGPTLQPNPETEAKDIYKTVQQPTVIPAPSQSTPDAGASDSDDEPFLSSVTWSALRAPASWKWPP
jgi:hypothetical protein